jgi:zinc protease
MRSQLRMGIAVVTVGLLALAGRAEEVPAPKKVTTIEGITEYRLDNGVKVLLFPDSAAAKVTVNMTVFVGSRHEGYGETGMAHLLEHMVFKGTPTHPDVPKALRDHGAQFNGTTWVDRTNYFETMDGTDRNLEFAIRLEADRLVNSHVKREDLLSEMTVVRNEFEQGENDPGSILSQRMLATAFEWHNYGKSTIGNRSDIERVPIENLQAFYKKFYQPDNVMVIVAGKFDERKALAYIGRHFGSLKKPERRLENTYTEEPPQDGERNVVLRRVGKVGVVGAVYHIPAGAHPDFAAVEVLEQVLVSEPSGRLYQALVASGKATSVAGSAYGLHDPGWIEFNVTADPSKPLEPLRDALTETVEQLPKTKFTEAEVTRGRRKILRSHERLMTDSNNIGRVLSESAAMGDWRMFFLHRDRVAKVTADDVARVAEKYLTRSNRTVGLFIPSNRPQRAPVPETPSLTAMLKDYQSTHKTTLGEPFEYTAENVEKRAQRSEMPCGVKVALLPKKTRGEQVVLMLKLRYGNAESLKGNVTAAEFLGPMLRRGTKGLTRQQLDDELDINSATLNAGGDLGELQFAMRTKRETLGESLKLLGKVLREPTFPEDEFQVMKREMRETLLEGQAEPQFLASTALRRKLNPYPADDVRYVPTPEESVARVDALTLDQVRKLYEEQVGGSVGELVVVGDFEGIDVTKQVAESLDGWKAKVPYRRVESKAHTDVKGEKVVIATPDKANAIYIAGFALALKDSDPDHAALQVGNFVLGGGTLSSRLGNRVRQKEGLSYGVASMYSAGAIDPTGRFLTYAICNPENMEKVEKAITEEVERLLRDGVDEKELAEAKAAYLAQIKVTRSSDGAAAGLLAEGLHVGRTLRFTVELEKRIGALSVSEVNDALRRHVDPKRLILIQAGDFRKK